MHPTCGPTQDDDIDGAVRYKTYVVLKAETQNPSIHWAYLPYSMHMVSGCPGGQAAAPRRALARLSRLSCIDTGPRLLLAWTSTPVVEVADVRVFARVPADVNKRRHTTTQIALACFPIKAVQ